MLAEMTSQTFAEAASMVDGGHETPVELLPFHMWMLPKISKNNGTPKSSILIGFSIINHPLFLETPTYCFVGAFQLWLFEFVWRHDEIVMVIEEGRPACPK